MPVTKAQLLNPIGVSTFNNGPVLVGSATSTGTPNQRLQVTGGTYILGSVGIATTNPQNPLQVGSGSTIVIVDSLGDIGIGTANATSKLHVVGNALVSGIVTATDGFNIGIQSAGTNINTGSILTLNFVGSGNTFAYNASTRTASISISGSGGGFSIRNYILSI